MKVLITLTDVEPAVRLNALLEAAGIATAMASPLDNLPAALKREKPDAIVFTGNLLDPQTLQLVRAQLWDGAAVLGLADVGDPQLELRLRSIGFNEVLTKPIPAEEVAERVKGLLERRRLAEETGLYGDSEAVREVLVKVEQIAPVSSTVLIEGESGTGKELVARAIHRLSPRRGEGVHRGERRRAAGDAAGERAVRPREGRVHRRGRAADRAVRAGARRARSFWTRSATCRRARR